MNVRPTIIAALQAAGLSLAGFLIPVLGQIAVLFVPVPLITATVLHGRRAGVSAMVIAAALVAVIVSLHAAVVLFVLALGCMALAIAGGMLRNLRHETIVLLGGLVPLVLLVIVLAPVFMEAGKPPVAVAEEYLRTSLAESRELYTKMGLTEIVQSLDSFGENVIFYAARLIPGIIITTTLMQALFCYGIARAIVLRRRPDLPLAARPPLALWHLPDQWVWGLIITLLLVALPDPAARFTGLNLLCLCLLAYTVQGTALVDHFLRKVRIPTLMRSVLHAIILTLPSVVAVIALGVVDIWADFRKVRTPLVKS
ncbi:MAG: YybS family protein [Nitrospirota bacterium]|nr:YybS family protein [Nitrospirota bacterium]